MIKKVLFVHHGGAEGGAPLSLLYLLNELKDTAVEIVVVNTRCDPDVNELYEKHGHRVVSTKIESFSHTDNGYNPLRSFRNWIVFFKWCLFFPVFCVRLKRIIKRENPAIIHFNSLVLVPYLFVSKSSGAKTVLHVRESMLPNSRRSRMMRATIDRYCDAVIAICARNAEALELNSIKPSVVYNPIDISRFDSKIDRLKIRKGMGVSADAFIAIFPGGANGRIKGIHDFCAAMELLKQKITNLFCFLPGSEGLYSTDPKVRKSIDKIKAYSKISNFTYDIENWFAASDVVLALHIKKHFSRSQIEALIMKRPFIGYNIGEIEEIIDASGCGFSCESGDIEGIVNACLSVYRRSPDFFESLDIGAEWAYENCSANGHSSKVKEIYSQIS